MHFLKDRGFSLPAYEITPRGAYEGRRDALKLLAGAALAAGAVPSAFGQAARPNKLAALPGVRSAVSAAATMEKLTPYADVTTYNNFYEFGTDKADPAKNAHTLKTRPW